MAKPEGQTPEQRALRARLAAYSMHARHDPKETTRQARAAFEDRFLRQVDPDNTLPAAERERRASAARRAYFTRLALESSRRRRDRRQRREPERHTEPER